MSSKYSDYCEVSNSWGNSDAALVDISKFQMKDVNKFKVLLFLSFAKYIIPINFKD